jgi:radical SAM protein with 4Fe4S-binding SPASM domain
VTAADRSGPVPRLAERFERGLTSPICLTWELTYACNLACVHCLSSSGRRDPAEFWAGNVRQPGGFEQVWRDSPLFTRLRQPQSGGACSSCAFYGSCRGGCMAAKFFTGLPPDPEWAQGHGQAALQARGLVSAPRPAGDHSHRGPLRARAAPGRPARTGPVPVIIGSRPSPASPPSPAAPPARVCDANPLAGFGSEASKDQHYVLDAAHTPRKG